MKILAFVIALAFFIGGLLLFGYAFQAAAAQGFIFFGGIVAVVIALAIPMHVLRGLDR